MPANKAPEPLVPAPGQPEEKPALSRRKVAGFASTPPTRSDLKHEICERDKIITAFCAGRLRHMMTDLKNELGPMLKKQKVSKSDALNILAKGLQDGLALNISEMLEELEDK